MKKIIALIGILFVFFNGMAQQNTSPTYNIIITGAGQTYSVANNASFNVVFNTEKPYKIIEQKFCTSVNTHQFFDHNEKSNYSILNLDNIKFRIIREDTSTKKEETESSKPTKKDTSIISFITQQLYPSDTMKNSNFFVGSFVKSIAGNNIPENELLDLFLKLNFGQQKKWFSFIGAEAGVGALNKNTSNAGVFKINDAIANLNFAIYRKPLVKVPLISDLCKKGDSNFINCYQKARLQQIEAKRKNANYYNDSLMRTGFIGAGLKLFNTQPYLGFHVGFTEINGPLFGSYILAGYYVSPYNPDSTGINQYRNNIYVEAGLNAFGEHVPSFLKSIRLKFGLMLPIGNKSDNPTNANVLSRLAIEVPLGHVFKF